MALEFGDLPGAILGGSFAAVQFLDRDGNPNLIVERDQGADIKVRWTITGSALQWLGGEFRVRTYAESKGGGPEVQIGKPGKTVSVGAFVAQVLQGGIPVSRTYETTITLAPNELPAEADPDTSGVYELDVIVTHRNFGLDTQMAGFQTSTIFQVREP